MLPALALRAEPPAREVMHAPPRPPGAPLLTSATLRRAYALLGPIEAAAAMGSHCYVLLQGGWSWGEVPPMLLYHQATTACMTAAVVTQVADGGVCRSPRASVCALGLFTNRLLLAGTWVEVGLQLIIVYSPLRQKGFGTAALPWTAWLVALPFVLLLFAANGGRKTLTNRLWHAGPAASHYAGQRIALPASVSSLACSAREYNETTPTSCRLRSSTARYRICCSRMHLTAAAISSSSKQQMITGVITSRTIVLVGSRPSATACTVMSRSVTMPSDCSRSRISTYPLLRAFILWAASCKVASGWMASTSRLMISLSCMISPLLFLKAVAVRS